LIFVPQKTSCIYTTILVMCHERYFMPSNGPP
jgi:hypothetical protein